MILFVSAFPGPDNDKDGMMQRVAAIDARFADANRVYVKVSLLRHWLPERRRLSSLLTVYRLNLVLYLPVIIALFFRARLVYVHSIGNALTILPAYFCKRVVTDLHGAVPEEFAMSGKSLAAWRYGLVERLVVRHSWRLVAVSTAMVAHFQGKYAVSTARFLTMPIFDDLPEQVPDDRPAGEPLGVVYAGGVQPWQNVELMLDAIRTAHNDCRYLILTGDQARMEKLAAERGVEGCIRITSVAKQEVYAYYRQADLGFVLREDSLVNRVACPTKLIEYLACGVVPIVLQPNIGDFAERGYAYVMLEEFLAGRLPSAEALRTMRDTNYRVVATMHQEAAAAMQQLSADITGSGGCCG